MNRILYPNPYLNIQTA